MKAAQSHVLHHVSTWCCNIESSTQENPPLPRQCKAETRCFRKSSPDSSFRGSPKTSVEEKTPLTAKKVHGV